MYAEVGRPAIPPERLLKAQLLIALYSVQSDRQFCERLDYDLFFRFFLDMSMDETPWDASIFTESRDRLIGDEVAVRFFENVVRASESAGLISLEHFAANGAVLEAWARLKGFWRNVEKRARRAREDDRPNSSVALQAEIVPDSADVIAWNRARSRHSLELLTALGSGVFLVAMFVVFCSILMK